MRQLKIPKLSYKLNAPFCQEKSNFTQKIILDQKLTYLDLSDAFR